MDWRCTAHDLVKLWQLITMSVFFSHVGVSAEGGYGGSVTYIEKIAIENKTSEKSTDIGTSHGFDFENMHCYC